MGTQSPKRTRLRAAPPEAAIPPEEDTVSIDAAIAMRATFANDSRAVLALFSVRWWNGLPAAGEAAKSRLALIEPHQKLAHNWHQIAKDSFVQLISTITY
jgi:hypothetical protein